MTFNPSILGLALTLFLATSGGHAQSICDVVTDCFVDDPTYSTFDGTVTCDHVAAETFCQVVDGFSKHCSATCKSCIPFPTCPVPDGKDAVVKSAVVPNSNTVNVYIQAKIEVYGAQMTLTCADDGSPIMIKEGKVAPEYEASFTLPTNNNLALMFSLSGDSIPAKDTMELMLSFDADLGSCKSVCVGGETLILAGLGGSYLDVCGGCDSPCDYDTPSPVVMSPPPSPPPSPSTSPPPFESCKGLCGGSAGGCFCDAACTAFDDCCVDAVELCLTNPSSPPTSPPSSDSCKGFCGGSAGACFCDDLCTAFDDCCVDAVELCFKTPPSPSPSPSPPPPPSPSPPPPPSPSPPQLPLEKVGLVQLILTSIESGKNSFTISINSTISIAGFTITIETSADSGITIEDVIENTPSGFTVSVNENLIVGLSTSDVVISPTAPEITPLMTVLLSEDNIAVEVCVGKAEFDSPDGEPAEVEIICAISPESPPTTDTDITVFPNTTDASGNIAVYFQSSVPVSGFQFRLILSDGSPAPINETLQGGVASETFQVFVGQDTGEVVALSLVGEVIAAQPTTTLLVVIGTNPPIPQGTEICIDNPVFTNTELIEFPVTALCSGNTAAVLSPSPPIPMQEGKQSEIFLVPIDLNERRFAIFISTDAFLKTFRTTIRLSDGSDITAFSFDNVRDGYEATKTQNELLIENNDPNQLFTGALAEKLIEIVFEDESIVPSEIVLDEVIIGDPLNFTIDLIEANTDLAATLDVRTSNASSTLDIFVVSTMPLTGFKLDFAKADADDVDVQVSGFEFGTESALEVAMPEESPGLLLGYSPFGNTIPVQHVSSLLISVQFKGVENSTQVCIQGSAFTDSLGAPISTFTLSQCAAVHVDDGGGSGDQTTDKGDKKKFPVVLEVILIIVGSALLILFSVILIRLVKSEKKHPRKDMMKLFKDEDANEPSNI